MHLLVKPPQLQLQLQTRCSAALVSEWSRFFAGPLLFPRCRISPRLRRFFFVFPVLNRATRRRDAGRSRWGGCRVPARPAGGCAAVGAVPAAPAQNRRHLRPHLRKSRCGWADLGRRTSRVRGGEQMSRLLATFIRTQMESTTRYQRNYCAPSSLYCSRIACSTAIARCDSPRSLLSLPCPFQPLPNSAMRLITRCIPKAPWAGPPATPGTGYPSRDLFVGGNNQLYMSKTGANGAIPCPITRLE